MALINRETWPLHRPWAAVLVVGTLAAILAYGFEANRHPWPTGSSPVGFTLGVVGGLLILFEFALLLRKKYRRLRIGPVKVWLAAHLWLGLLTIPLAVLHSGFYLGGSLGTLLMAVFALVIASGLYGLTVQIWLPRRMLDEVPFETVYSQIDTVIASLRRDVQRLLWAVDPEFLLPAADGLPDQTAEEEEEGPDLRKFASVDETGAVRGAVLRSRAAEVRADDSRPLAAFVRDYVGPFLRPRINRGHPLLSERRSAVLFRTLRGASEPGLDETIGLLEGLCRQRRDLDRQTHMHRWLHGWLLIHTPLSVVLLVLLGAHVVTAVMWW